MPETQKSYFALQLFCATLLFCMQLARITILNARQGGFFYWLGKYSLFAFLSLCLSTFFSLGGLFFYLVSTSPPIPDLSAYGKFAPTVSSIYAADGTLLAEIGKEHRSLVPFSKIPRRLIEAVLATEDRRFFQHRGLDYWGLGRAILEDIKAGKLVQGGSTITQQIAKAHLFSDKSYTRKIREAVLARRLEARYTKQEIITVYLNMVFFGHIKEKDVDVYGIQAASRHYFNRDLGELTLPQMALLAGMIQAPTRYSPFSSHPEEAERRKNQVLENMKEAGYLSEEEFQKEKLAPVEIASRRDTYREVSPYFVDYVKKWLKQTNLPISLEKGGYVIETTVVPFLDVLATENIDHTVRTLDKRQGFRGPEAHVIGTEREKILEKMKLLYPGPLKEDELYQGLVDAVETNRAWVLVGNHRLPLPLKNMRWAAKYSKKDATNDRKLDSVKQALKEGDVIWVRLFPQTPPRPFSEYRFHLERKGNTTETEMDATWVDEKDTKYYSTSSERELMLEQTPRPQGAYYMVDLHTGYVLSMVGSSDYDRSEFNRTLQSCRQPGSAYKPIYYSLALDKGYGYDSLWHDRLKEEVDEVTGEKWVPKNVNHQYRPLVTLEKALTWSKNPPSLEIFREVGKDEVKAWARKLGFTTPIHADDALALGASCVRMDELTKAFAVFAKNGMPLEPVYIKRILDREGNILWDQSAWDDPDIGISHRIMRMAKAAFQQKQPLITPKTAWLTTNLLRKVISDGHSKMIRDANIIAAGKTGTSSRTSDVWFVGFTSKWISTAWVGDDTYERELGFKDASFTISVPMWTRYMYAATRYLDSPMEEIPTERPEGVSPQDRGGTKERGQAGEKK